MRSRPVISLVCAGVSILAAAVDGAGKTPSPTSTPTATATPTPTPACPSSCHYNCSIDKKCSVGGGAAQDSCMAVAGEEVTYTYRVDAGPPLGDLQIIVEVVDDKLGVIGQTSTGTLSRTTTLDETTTNTATITDLKLAGNYTCFNQSDFDDSTTVTVISPTPTATPTATPAPGCADLWPVAKICTIGKGQSPSNNPTLSHCITGNVVDPSALGPTAHRIPVCGGTEVIVVVTDTSGTPTNTSDGSLSCNASGCSGVVNAVEKYKSVSQDGKDTDRMTLLPK